MNDKEQNNKDNNKENSKENSKVWSTYYIMKSVLEKQNMPISAENFPSDQFIIKNLPEAIRKTDGAEIPAKRALAAASIATIAIAGGIIAPVGMAFFGTISGATALISGLTSSAIAVISGRETQKTIKEIKQNHVKNIVQELLTMHVVDKAKELKDSFFSRFKKNDKEKRKTISLDKNDPERRLGDDFEVSTVEPVNDNKKIDNGKNNQVNSMLSGFSTILKLKETWDKSATDENKKKLQESIEQTKDNAEDILDNTKEKFKETLKKLKKYRRGNDK